MAVKKETGAQEDKKKRTNKRFALACGLVFAIGFYDGFFGPGTGIFLFMVLVLVTGLDAVRATGTTKLINGTTNLAALAVFLTKGSLHISLGLTMACANAMGGYVGSKMAMDKGQRLIRFVVIAVVLAMSARLAYDVWLAKS